MSEESLKEVERSGYIKHNHHHIEEIEDGKKAVLRVNITEESLNPYGYVHGGLIFGLGDTAMGTLARSTGKKAVTLNCTITYLRPTSGTTVKAVAEMIKNGKQTCYMRCNFYDENEKLTATMDSNYFYID